MYVVRTVESYVKTASRQFPAVLLTGARQVGKTTCLKHLIGKARTYVSLDDKMSLALAKEDPALFLERFEPPVLIDEIQYAPELLPRIKVLADESKKAGMFWLTGSQQFHLMKEISETLAGRVAIIQMLGLSRRELIGEDARPFLPKLSDIKRRLGQSDGLSLMDLYRTIWRGAFPAVALNRKLDRQLFYNSYVQTYLQRDLRDLARVGDEMAFLRFLKAAAARTGQLLNLTDMARDADVAPNTAKSWLSILQASGIIYLLECFHTNLSKRLIKAPKLYFLDTGLCSYLTDWSSPETLESGAMSGPILETWIMAELLKGYWHNGRRAPFYYYRDKDQKEIDLLIIQDGVIYPLEFKKTSAPGKDSVKHFSVLGKLNLPVGPGGVLCLCPDVMPLGRSAQAIPLAVL